MIEIIETPPPLPLQKSKSAVSLLATRAKGGARESALNDDIPDESTRPHNKDTRPAIEFFSAVFLPACIEKDGPLQKGDWHVVFAFGTVVCLIEEKDKQEFTYDPLGDNCYPRHRFVSEKEMRKRLRENVKEYNLIISAHPERANIIRAAYARLMGSGYPCPGGVEADTTTFPMTTGLDETRLWATRFPSLGHETERIFSLSVAKYRGEADAKGREERRLDYMMPRIVAIVAKDAKVAYFY